uniref:Sushi domain-containing protein n=1 Tax=Pelodiscus sinensis TaxID=13735 RepID=K7G928_PELSI
CEQPPDVDFGNVISGEKLQYVESDTVQYGCNPGYTLGGSQWIKCNGRNWTPPPTCLEAGKKCGRSPVVANGDITTFAQKEYTSGSFVEYTCQKLYSLRGQNKSFCDNGNWTEIPVCEGAKMLWKKCKTMAILCIPTAIKFSVKFFTRICLKKKQVLRIRNKILCNGKFGPMLNEAEQIEGRCGPPPSIQNGDIISERLPVYSAGSSVEYKCQRFHGMTGSTTITCRLGKWTAPPVCSVSEAARKCGRPPAIINGDIKILPQKEYESGSRVEYRCQSFHRMRGSAFVSCESGQWTDPPVCLEPCTIIPEDMEKNNIHLKWTWKTKLYLESGDFAEFECKNEYVREPTSSAFRVQCMEGKLAYPKCK